MTLARRPFLFAAASGALLGPRLATGRELVVSGSGIVATVHRDVGAFSGVGVGGPFAVVLRPAARAAIEIVGDDNVVPLIETTARHRRHRSLQIALRRGVRFEARTPVAITVDYVASTRSPSAA
ncbi:MAG: hypothetical protein ABI364_06780 [Caldimonas sp.]